MKAATSPSSSSLYSTYHCRTVSDDTNERYKRTLQSINKTETESLNIEKIKTAKDMIRDSLELFYLPQDKLTFTNSITHKIELRWL